MEDKEKNDLDIESLLPVAKDAQSEIIKNILQENDVDKLKDLTHLFNAHQAKRQVLRVSALNDVQDALVQQMITRLNNRPDNFDNADIAGWMKVVQSTLDTSQKSLTQIDTVPTITYQQNNQININTVDSLSKESRDRISEFLQNILHNNQEVIDLDSLDTVLLDESEEIIDEDEE